MKVLEKLRPPAHVGWRDHAIGALLGLAYVAWLIPGARTLGFPRDEGIYFRAGHEYFQWWRSILERGSDAFKQGAIDSAFHMNAEHPSLMKTLFGASEYFFHEKWHVFDDASTAFRLPGMATAGLTLWLVYLFGARIWNRRTGLVGAALFALMPRVFFHSHLACFDVPIAAMWTLSIYVYWRGLERRSLGKTIAWALGAGVAFGLALDTKHNAWVLPFVVTPHGLFVLWRSHRAGRTIVPWNLLGMAIVGPLVLFALWPYLWHDTHDRLAFWVNFMTHHEYYNIEFLHRNYFGPPSPKLYVPVMIAATVPTVTLVLFGVGVVDRARVALRRLRAWAWPLVGRDGGVAPEADPRETDLLLALSFSACLALFFISTTPIFGATKHWLPAYPVLALIAGRGFDLVTGAMHRALPATMDARKRLAADLGLAACVLAAPLAVTAHSHPFGLSTYVPLVGGTAGGADLGLNRQFWGFTTQSAAAEYLNAKAPQNATVFILDTTWDAWARMQQEGRVRRDLHVTQSPHEAMYSLVQHELHMTEVDYDIWVALGTDAPVYIVTHDGVPIVSIYKRP